MRLSEAIRLGAMLRPNQAFYVLFDDDKNASCALGAAGEAAGLLGPDPRRFAKKAPPEWKAVVLQSVECPECRMVVDDRLDQTIIHLNNRHKWTRERIADWVESHEPVAEPASVAAVREDADQPVVSPRA